jgi:hypothetical protein
MNVQAAAISLQGINFTVVLVNMELLKNSGEADMAIDTLQPNFGNFPVVLMAQHEDASPVYYGDAKLVELLRGVPVEQMPWMDYNVS